MNRRTEITIEMRRVLSISLRGGTIKAWCSKCGRQVSMVGPDGAAAIAEASVRTINRWVEAELLHFSEAPSGSLFICLNSLGVMFDRD
ncbi:MAG: hypothetical protein DMF73_16650 [Acidobacteria bacterium]|nr:MAG: hypothetical protein DMF73_16650 [Acidobacteriota bacterium]